MIDGLRAAPRISIVMPVHDAAQFLTTTLSSVVAQTFPDWELLAVDDGSTDDSARLLNCAAAIDPRIRPLSTGINMGAPRARNYAMDAARGRFLAFLDADDLWHPSKLAHQLGVMETTGIPLSCTAYLRHNIETGQKTVIGVPERVSRRDLLKTNMIGCSTVMMDTEFFGFRHMPLLRHGEDFAFWLELLTATPFAMGLPQVLTTYRQHSHSLSSVKKHAATDVWTLYRHSLNLPLPAAVWYFCHYATRGLARHRMPKLARALGWLQDGE